MLNMSAYFLYDLLEVTDDARMNEYREKVGPNVEQFGGTYRVIGGEQKPLEGDWKLNFPVLIEFESKDAALRWYDSPEYAPLKALRLTAAKQRRIDRR
jgi:uncharacterized protein (DUF1330 family)